MNKCLVLVVLFLNRQSISNLNELHYSQVVNRQMTDADDND